MSKRISITFEYWDEEKEGYVPKSDNFFVRDYDISLGSIQRQLQKLKMFREKYKRVK